MTQSSEPVEGSVVELREVFRPFGQWNFKSPMLHAGTKGMVETLDPRTRAVIVRFPGHLPVRVPRSLLRITGARGPLPQQPPGPPPGL